MGDNLIMSKKERQRKAIAEQVLLGLIPRRDAKKRLNISNRQLIRVLKRYREEGDVGLVHKNRGKRSGRAYAEEIKAKILVLYQQKYMGFGPTLASEKLLEDDELSVHAETLRLWLKKAGLWQARRKRKAHRSHRERRSRFGELLQLDGSIHAWFDGIEKKQCLMNMVDDATGKTLALLDTGETTRAAFALLRWWITEAGIPMVIYVDLKSLYVSPKALRYDDSDELVEPEWLTHFSKACKKLGIEIIKAYSPQAKGRVERNHAVYQDRFLKELKLKNVNTIAGANAILSGGFVNSLNEKFAKPAASSEDAHVHLSNGDDLDQILCWEFTRQIHNDWTVQFENKLYQIKRSSHYATRPKQKITIRKHLDDSVSLWYKDQRLEAVVITKTVTNQAMADKKIGHDSVKRSQLSRANRHKTPWGQFNTNWLKTPSYPQGPQSV